MPHTPNSGRRATIHDVARAAGVAASTVSRAFSHPDRLSPATRQHVVETAARLSYRPNPVAQALPGGRTRTLALLVPDITNPFFFGLIRGAERRAADAGYTLVLADTGESASMESTHLDRLAGTVDGFVLASSRLEAARLRVIVESCPAIAVNTVVDGAPCVVIDHDQAMRQAAEHLASLGHSRLAYLAGPAASWSDRSRWRALAAAARRLGLSATRLGPFPPTVVGGAAAADAALIASANDGVTGLVAYNDLLAIGALRRLADRDIRVPDQLSVVGCDDIFGADFCQPPLTTLAADIEQAGRAAVGLLLAEIDAPAPADSDDPPAPERVVLPCSLQVRESTGPAPR